MAMVRMTRGRCSLLLNKEAAHPSDEAGQRSESTDLFAPLHLALLFWQQQLIAALVPSCCIVAHFEPLVRPGHRPRGASLVGDDGWQGHVIGRGVFCDSLGALHD